MKRIPLYVYVAHNNPQGAASVINHFKLMPPKDGYDLIRGLRHVMITEGEEGFRQIAKVHPDRNLILDAEEQEVVVVDEKKSGCDGNTSCGCNKEKKSNACGCSGSSGFDGEQKVAPEVKKEEKQLTKEDISIEVKRAIGETGSFLKDSFPYIALIGVVGLIYMGVKK